MSNETRVKRSYYYADCNEFLNASEEAILGELTDSHMPLTLTVQQEQAWKEEIRILKQDVYGGKDEDTDYKQVETSVASVCHKLVGGHGSPCEH